ncbi:delta fatty acid desaturase [Leifsonia sp. Root227]|jgi:fatty acid desaturase|uniref:fatty acid desaturase family protein n=1 Tax=Leifsonia sp. Root227 TaxID=1736496 RepID=UPI000700B34E|nr:acyl-CoA desaturase [Leifsonia sp. Root227]KRC51706.1 delta fatty acid desaturase [Leifsonia sp. Root227]
MVTLAPTSAPSASTLGPIRRTGARIDAAPPVTQSFKILLNTVRDQGLLRRARLFYALVASGLVLALGGAVAGMILLGDSWFQLLIAAALGLIFTQFAFLAHEASHRQIANSGPMNDRLGRMLATLVVGISYSWWMTKHTRHHANPNTIGKDPDIETDTISFVEEDAAKAKGLIAAITRKQGYLFFPLLLLEGFNLHGRSFGTLFQRGKVDGRGKEFTFLAIRFSLYFGAIFWLLPLGMAFAFIGVQLAVFGLYMGASFAPNHKGMPLIGRGVKVDFLSRQVLTSRNVVGFGMTGLLGGLNYQVEHHLFPSMARPHLRKAAAIVREHCHTENIPYTETTLLNSYGIVIEYLNRVGLSARDPFDCPAAASMR